ncbi:MAG: hypothetical protein KJ964_04445 [Verrucomicrobia bacterium]|nr:hypothetical protein [Verrucomicrobiota bacterium]MBU1734541.1 hypothetical protein [Verrucomicrobiota bacterium]MBU1856610.1 hypothetical protein [Verrucomicrobiota bacterium]
MTRYMDQRGRLILAAFCVMMFVCWPGVETARSQDAFPLKDGDTWVMVGDSITAQHLHSNYLEAYCYARFPKWTFRFRNSGVGGDTIPRTLARFDWDVTPWKPTVVSVELGMNDQGPFTAGAYITNMSLLTDRIVHIGARPVFLTSSPLNNGVAITNPPGTSNNNLDNFATALRAFAAEQKAPFADQFHVLVNVWAGNKPIEKIHRLAEDIRNAVKDNALPGREQLMQWLEVWAKSEMQGRGASLGGDPVHPGPAGQLTMCAALLQELKAPGLVSKATLDNTGKVGELIQCQVTNSVVGKEGGLSFDRLDECLPLPIPDEARGALLVYPSLAELSQWILAVTGLKAGQYQVNIDGVNVASVTADELSKGWNMGTLTKGAVADQCRHILQLVSIKESCVSQWRGQSRAWAQTPSNSLRANLDQLGKQVLEADAKIREAAQPKSHHFSITPQNKL